MQNLLFHNQRFNNSRRELLDIEAPIDLQDLIVLPKILLPNQIYKCRILYDTEIHQIEFVPYTPKKIQSLQLVHTSQLDYAHKFADRTALRSLLQKKGKANGILIVKNGWITDTSYANVALFDGQQWFTPSTPLLEGTKCAQLLQQNILTIADIRVSDLKHFEKLRLVNSMMDWENSIEVEVGKIF